MQRRSTSKRILDIVCSAIGLSVLSPLLVVIAAIIRLSDGGPVLFRQERVGRRGTRFRIWKFRTMTAEAGRRGRAITVGEDPRITRVGYWLRKLKLDELPQLINVFRGEMSLVGPRPEVPKYVSLYTDDQRRILDVQPGITDPASIHYRGESELLAEASDPERAYVETIMPDKIRRSLDYAARASLVSDLGILLQTALMIVFRRRSRGETSSPVAKTATICMLSAEHPSQDKRVFQKEAISLARAGFRVVHLCPGPVAGRESVDGVELMVYRKRKGKLFRLLMLPGLFWKARAVGADAYHCNEPDSWLVGVALRLLCGKIVVFDCHEHYPGQVVRWLPRSLRTVGAWAMKYYLQVLGLLTHRIVLAKYSVADDFSWSRSRHTVVLNTTPLAALQDAGRATAQPITHADRATFTFVHIGVIRRERGSEELLEAMRILDRRRAKPFRVVIVGEFKDGSEQDFFEKARTYGVHDRIEFHRWMPFAEAFALVRQSHAGLILFQKTLANNVRGMPHKMFDYMLSGLPVIAPDFAPDIAGVLDEAGAGLLIDTSKPEALADTMQTLIEDRWLARQLGERGRQAVFEKYHWERDAQTLVAAYHELLGTTADQSACPSVTKVA